MNQEKIGKFIQKKRHDKKLTQAQLAECLGVSEKSISNWENGRNMPDLSLFKPLCDVLDITINDLINGETIKNNQIKEISEKNILNTIIYSNNTIIKNKNIISLCIIIFGILIIISALMSFKSESSFGSIYSIVGGIILLAGVNNYIKITKFKRIFLNIILFILYLLFLITIDFLSVNYMGQVPRFSYLKESSDNMIVYKSLFTNVYRINVDELNEYLIVDNKKVYTSDTVPKVPFNRSKSGIDNIINYKSKYIGDNTNIINLVYNLPLSEYKPVFEINSENNELTINYQITYWYIDNDYLKQSLVYNSVSLFLLIDNLNSIKYNFTGYDYYITRTDIEEYTNYNKITNKDKFNKYLESKINDLEFINNEFNKLFK